MVSHEQYQEILGVVKGINDPKISISKALMLNNIYELASWCTSIVARGKDGKIIHVRNMDYDYPELLKAITYIGHFKKRNKTVFFAVMFAGSVGIFTGIKPNNFSISLNQRLPREDENNALWNIGLGFTGR